MGRYGKLKCFSGKHPREGTSQEKLARSLTPSYSELKNVSLLAKRLIKDNSDIDTLVMAHTEDLIQFEHTNADLPLHQPTSTTHSRCSTAASWHPPAAPTSNGVQPLWSLARYSAAHLAHNGLPALKTRRRTHSSLHHPALWTAGERPSGDHGLLDRMLAMQHQAACRVRPGLDRRLRSRGTPDACSVARSILCETGVDAGPNQLLPDSAANLAETVMHFADRMDRNGQLTLTELQAFLPTHPFTLWIRPRIGRYTRGNQGSLQMGGLQRACNDFFCTQQARPDSSCLQPAAPMPSSFRRRTASHYVQLDLERLLGWSRDAPVAACLPKAEHRTVTTQHLRALQRFLDEHASSDGSLTWRLRGVDQRFSGHRSTITLQEGQACLAELLHQRHPPAAGSNRVSWFVSVDWNCPFESLVAAIEHHEQAQGMSHNSCWWVDIFAHNAHQLEATGVHIGTVHDSVSTCDGMLLVLRHPAPALSRLWSLLELATMRQVRQTREYKLDIVAVDAQGRLQLLTDGLSPVELTSEAESPGVGYHSKMEREGCFPFKLLLCGYQTNVCEAQVALREDRDEILTALTGFSVHTNRADALQEVNTMLGAIFAAAAVNQATHRSVVGKALQVLNADERLEMLTLDFSCCQKLCDTGLVGYGLNGLVHLRALQMDFSQCQIQDLNSLWKGISVFAGLQELSIRCARCPKLHDAGGVASLGCLRILHLDLSGCMLDNVERLSRLLGSFYSLHELSIYLRHCSQLLDVSPLWEGLANLSLLRLLSISLDGCDQLSILNRPHRKLSVLHKVLVNCNGCLQLQGEQFESLDEMFADVADVRILHGSVFESVGVTSSQPVPSLIK